MEQLGDIVRSLRLAKGLGIKKLAQELALSHSYISHIERGKAIPSDSLLRKLAAYFGANEEELLLASGRLPKDVKKILYEHPKEAVKVLRESFPGYGNNSR